MLKNKPFSKTELSDQLKNVREEIDSLASTFNVSNGQGFGGSTSDERQLKYYIECKQYEESRLARDLNTLVDRFQNNIST